MRGVVHSGRSRPTHSSAWPEGISLAERYPEEWLEAERRTAEVPVAMGGAANVELLYDVVRSLRPDRVLETGVALGWSSLAILLALESLGHGELVSIDMPYPGMKNDAFVGIAVPSHLHSRWTLIRRPDRDVLRSTRPALRSDRPRAL